MAVHSMVLPGGCATAVVGFDVLVPGGRILFRRFSRVRGVLSHSERGPSFSYGPLSFSLSIVVYTGKVFPYSDVRFTTCISDIVTVYLH